MAAGILTGLAACVHVRVSSGKPAPTIQSVEAIRYATLSNFPVALLVRGADTSRHLDIAAMVWLIRRSDGTAILMDAGFYRDKFMQRWKPTNYRLPSEAVMLAGVRPEQVTDIIVSHVHWDHMDGADLFPNATLWIQREEFTHHTDESGKVLDRAIDAEDAVMLATLNRAGRVKLVDGEQEIIPGIRVYTGGKHTYASQFATVQSPVGVIVLASDNAYLYENLDQHRPIAQTLDSLSNLRAQERMKSLASSPRLIVPGHDPEVLTRFGGGSIVVIK
jgi:glyoxylase-like metal-dependent hydrolase (beta-lactamase superfamily II)